MFGDNIAYTGYARDTIADINIKLIQYKIDVSMRVYTVIHSNLWQYGFLLIDGWKFSLEFEICFFATGKAAKFYLIFSFYKSSNDSLYS